MVCNSVPLRGTLPGGLVLVRAAAAVALVVALSSPAAAGPLPDGSYVVPPARAGGQQALLLLLPDTGASGAGLRAVAESATASARGLRLWVAVAGVGAGPAGAAAQVERLRADVAALGYAAPDAEVVVAGVGRGGAAGAAAVTDDVARTAGLGDGTADVDLRVLAELDRSVRVVASLAGRTNDATVLPAASAVTSGPAGQVLADLVLAARGRTDRLQARLAADALVRAVDAAALAERGPVCADVQRHTADADPALLAVTDRASAQLVAPTPDGVATGDLGGFLYDKAELHDEGTTARLVTSSYALGGSPAYEVMCKTKSRSAVALALTGDHTAVDATPPTCAGFTEATLATAAAALSPAARARTGGVTVLPDDPKRAGPEWVFSPLTQRPADPATGRWEVRSPSLLTELSDTELDPEFAGNHYCKALSPLRALELLLDDALPPV
jgi:hypothetical protein